MTASPVEPLFVRRTARSAWLSKMANEDASFNVSSEQAEWGFAIPSVFRVLASPRSGQTFPRPPRKGDPREYSCGYWSGLLHMLLYSLGWARPDRGLWWWYQSGKPTDDLRLQLLAEVFDFDGQLDWFAAWLWDSPQSFREHSLSSSFHRLTGWSDSDIRPTVDRGWIESKRRDATTSGLHAPLGADLDALHLLTHCDGPLNGSAQPNTQLWQVEPSGRRAVLILDSMMGWYAALCEAAESLPTMNDQSWRVDLIVKPTGWLGTYRRSRESGLWFSGRHRFHAPGA